MASHRSSTHGTDESARAAEAGRRLAAVIEDTRATGAVPARFGEGEAPVPIPAEAARLLLDILERMARGQAVTLAEADEAPSSRRAALDEMTAIDQDLGLQ